MDSNKGKEMFTEKQRFVRLEMTNNGHNKYYEVEIKRQSSDYELWVHWGRIGNKGSWQKKRGYAHFNSAKVAAEKIVQSKKDRGYKICGKTVTKENTPQEETKQKVDKQYQRFIALLE